MVSKAHGLASASQVLTGNLQYYTVWCESPNAFSDPDNATGYTYTKPKTSDEEMTEMITHTTAAAHPLEIYLTKGLSVEKGAKTATEA